MGIQGLATKLVPYATPIQWQKRGPNAVDNQSGGLLIDGPGFSHWIHGQAYGMRCRDLGGTEAVPSYQEVADLALTWLERFESFGLHVYVFA